MKHSTFVLVSLTSSIAIAQPAIPAGVPAGQPFVPMAMEEPEVANPLRAPGFVTLDRGDATSRAGAELSYLMLDGDADGTALRFDIHGQYIDAKSGLGGYGYVPMSFLSGEDDSHFELGGAEVGALYTTRMAPEIGLVLRGGVVLPTASDDFGAVLQNAITSYGRPSDIANSTSNTVIRLSASPMFRSGQLFARVDVGLDFLADSDDSDDNALLRIGPGIGFDGGTFAVTGELNIFRGVGGDSTNEISSFAAISGRFTSGRTSPYAAIVFPLDDQLRDFVNAALTLGVEAQL